jgi:hypothetical protein
MRMKKVVVSFRGKKYDVGNVSPSSLCLSFIYIFYLYLFICFSLFLSFFIFIYSFFFCVLSFLFYLFASLFVSLFPSYLLIIFFLSLLYSFTVSHHFINHHKWFISIPSQHHSITTSFHLNFFPTIND